MTRTLTFHENIESGLFISVNLNCRRLGHLKRRTRKEAWEWWTLDARYAKDLKLNRNTKEAKAKIREMLA